MNELPEALNIAGQLNDAVCGKRIAAVSAGQLNHKFAWYYGEPAAYSELLAGKAFGVATARGSWVEIKVHLLLREVLGAVKFRQTSYSFVQLFLQDDYRRVFFLTDQKRRVGQQ